MPSPIRRRDSQPGSPRSSTRGPTTTATSKRAVDLDSLLTNITLYWVTGAINSSFWPYYAVRHEPWPVPLTRSSTPTAYASFPGEIRHPPRMFAEQVFNIQRWTEMPRGGHFAALEAPDLLAADVATFFGALRRR